MESTHAFVCPVFDSGTQLREQFCSCVTRATLVRSLRWNDAFRLTRWRWYCV